MGWWQRRGERRERSRRFYAAIEAENRLAYTEGGERLRVLEEDSGELERAQLVAGSGMALYLLVLLVTVVPLIALFMLIQQLTD